MKQQLEIIRQRLTKKCADLQKRREALLSRRKLNSQSQNNVPHIVTTTSFVTIATTTITNSTTTLTNSATTLTNSATTSATTTTNATIAKTTSPTLGTTTASSAISNLMNAGKYSRQNSTCSSCADATPSHDLPSTNQNKAPLVQRKSGKYNIPYSFLLSFIFYCEPMK